MLPARQNNSVVAWHADELKGRGFNISRHFPETGIKTENVGMASANRN